MTNHCLLLDSGALRLCSSQQGDRQANQYYEWQDANTKFINSACIKSVLLSRQDIVIQLVACALGLHHSKLPWQLHLLCHSGNRQPGPELTGQQLFCPLERLTIQL